MNLGGMNKRIHFVISVLMILGIFYFIMTIGNNPFMSCAYFVVEYVLKSDMKDK